jgi:hypothetical protein
MGALLASLMPTADCWVHMRTPHGMCRPGGGQGACPCMGGAIPAEADCEICSPLLRMFASGPVDAVCVVCGSCERSWASCLVRPGPGVWCQAAPPPEAVPVTSQSAQAVPCSSGGAWHGRFEVGALATRRLRPQTPSQHQQQGQRRMPGTSGQLGSSRHHACWQPAGSRSSEASALTSSNSKSQRQLERRHAVRSSSAHSWDGAACALQPVPRHAWSPEPVSSPSPKGWASALPADPCATGEFHSSVHACPAQPSLLSSACATCNSRRGSQLTDACRERRPTRARGVVVVSSLNVMSRLMTTLSILVLKL